jgi:hypothetical protein
MLRLTGLTSFLAGHLVVPRAQQSDGRGCLVSAMASGFGLGKA